jgi:hypothetical protein
MTFAATDLLFDHATIFEMNAKASPSVRQPQIRGRRTKRQRQPLSITKTKEQHNPNHRTKRQPQRPESQPKWLSRTDKVVDAPHKGLDWVVPDFSTIRRRQRMLAVNIPYRAAKGLLHLLIPFYGLKPNHFQSVDSTGIKIEREGIWNARKHGSSKRRVWRKIHIAIDE